MAPEPTTLGEKLAVPTGRPSGAFRHWMREALYAVLNTILLIGVAGTLLVWAWLGSKADTIIMVEILLGLVVLLLIVFGRRGAGKPAQPIAQRDDHMLLAGDRQGFMRDLRLDAKTAVFDGSNIYHFGRANDLHAHPLGMIINQLREEGYRIVCFFDANIFYRLSEHGVYPQHQRHSLDLLMDIFGLAADEIYVVPSGSQADKYVLNALRHLPLAFVISNDQFRDYAKTYGAVMKGDQWRKGVLISKNEIRLNKHKFRTPLYLA